MVDLCNRLGAIGVGFRYRSRKEKDKIRIGFGIAQKHGIGFADLQSISGTVFEKWLGVGYA